VLLYETEDSGFANSVIDELQRAGIDSYRTGGALPGGSTFTICIHIRNPGDFQKANEILVQQGAAIDVPPRISLSSIIVAATLGAVVITLMVLGVWK